MALSLDFAFEGFRLIGKKPGLFLGWCLFYILISLVTVAIVAVVSGPQLLSLINQTAGGTTAPADPTAMLALVSGIFPGLFVGIIVAGIGSLMFRCAVYRAMLKPADKSPAYLRLGADEWRQFLLSLLMILVILGLYLVIVLGAAMIVGVSSLSQNEIVKGLGIFVAVVGALGVLIWFLLRVSLISVYSFDKAKIDLSGALQVTKGWVWTLLGGYIILLIMLIILQIVVTSLFYGVTLVSSGFSMEPLKKAANPDFTQILSLLGPVFIAQMLINILLSVFSEVAFWSAQVSAYKSLTPTPVDTVVSAFDAPEAVPGPDTL